MSDDSQDKATRDLLSEKFESPPILPLELIQHLKSGVPLDDNEFDQILPPLFRFLSPVHWTSIKVAQTLAEWLQPYKGKKFIDLGSGVGKLCILLRLLTDLEIYGVEQRRNLVAISDEIVSVNNLDRVKFSNGNLIDLNWADYDIYYLYNPFQEHVSALNAFLIDSNIKMSTDHYRQYIAKVSEELKKAKEGTVLITYHGYGGSTNKFWKLIHSQFIEGGFLCMWIKDSKQSNTRTTSVPSFFKFFSEES
ncbi:methyltransferase domain-containing protein [Bdellovibrio bacteriovorus]|uniref:methyltransferase domain-containing protein n=1 Tax=Bdellovibrio TaxID=958 RepID=UPI0035A943C1